MFTKASKKLFACLFFAAYAASAHAVSLDFITAIGGNAEQILNYYNGEPIKTAQRDRTTVFLLDPVRSLWRISLFQARATNQAAATPFSSLCPPEGSL
jgi:hypothetical protein